MKNNKIKIFILIVALILLIILCLCLVLKKSGIEKENEKTVMEVAIKTQEGEIVLKLDDCNLSEYFYQKLPLNSLKIGDDGKIIFQLDYSVNEMDLEKVVQGSSINSGEIVYDVNKNSVIIAKSDYVVEEDEFIYIIGDTTKGKDMIDDLTRTVSIRKYNEKTFEN